MSSEIRQKSTLIFGCGNILLGDDGFGPAVVERLNQAYRLPEEAAALDVGTSIREILFDLILSEDKPKRLIILDAVDQAGRTPGQVFEIGVDDIPAVKIHDFSLHQFPTVNMLKELKEHTQIDIKVIVVQVKEIPEEIRPGLSAPVAAAVDTACRLILENI